MLKDILKSVYSNSVSQISPKPTSDFSCKCGGQFGESLCFVCTAHFPPQAGVPPFHILLHGQLTKHHASRATGCNSQQTGDKSVWVSCSSLPSSK